MIRPPEWTLAVVWVMMNTSVLVTLLTRYAIAVAQHLLALVTRGRSVEHEKPSQKCLKC